MNYVIETREINFCIFTMTKTGCFVPIITKKATEDEFDHFRMPWVLKIEDIGQDELPLSWPQSSE